MKKLKYRYSKLMCTMIRYQIREKLKTPTEKLKKCSLLPYMEIFKKHVDHPLTLFSNFKCEIMLAVPSAN